MSFLSDFAFAEFKSEFSEKTKEKNVALKAIEKDNFQINESYFENTDKKNESQKDYNYVGDDQIVAAVLAWFLGPWGVHRFYLGYKGIAIVQLILGLSIVGLLITIPWALVDFIMILMGKLLPVSGFYLNSF